MSDVTTVVTEPEEKDVTQGTVEPEGNQGRTFTRADVAKMLKAERGKWEEEQAQATEQAIAAALEKFKAESELSGKELEEFRRKEAEAEKQTMLDEIDRLKKDKVKRELTDEAIKTLSKRGLPVNDIVLGFVVKDTAEDTLEAIGGIEQIITAVKSQFAQSEPPKVSNPMGGKATESRAEMFRQARIIK
jgi:hypothetical protein